MNPTYVQTVNLLLDIAPTVFQTPRFAMKGGTALNLFVQDMLSGLNSNSRFSIHAFG